MDKVKELKVFSKTIEEIEFFVICENQEQAERFFAGLKPSLTPEETFYLINDNGIRFLDVNMIQKILMMGELDGKYDNLLHDN